MELDSTPTRTTTKTTKLLLGPLSIARGQKPNGTKIIQGNKKCAREKKMCKRTKNVPTSQNEDREGHIGSCGKFRY